MSAMVDSAFTTMPRAASAALISRSVIPGWRNSNRGKSPGEGCFLFFPNGLAF
jgi:hypothetical protein